MGRKKGKKYTAEFRANAVRMVRDSDKPIAEVARELGVTYGALYEWVRKAEGRPRPGHGASTLTAEEAEVQRLRSENDELRMERDFLKKAAAFFAKHGT